jgi:hypothetical protein
MNSSLLKIYILAYLLLSIMFAVYWGDNFTKFVHYKGDDLIVCVKVMVVLTYVLFILLQLSVKKVNLLILLFLPVTLAVVSFIIGLIVFLVTNIPGTPSQTTFIYSIVYAIVASASSMFIWKPNRKGNVANE